MANPDISVHDVAGDEITAGSPLALLTATPGTPTTPDTVITVRNNDAGGPAVDPARDFRLSITARIAGDTGEPKADGLAYLVTRALQAQVTAVSGGATRSTDDARWPAISRALPRLPRQHSHPASM